MNNTAPSLSPTSPSLQRAISCGIPALALLVLVGCATPSASTTPEPDGTASVSDAVDENSDAIFLVTAAELAGRDEDYEKAVEFYSKAAQVSDDPQVAQRATQIAVYAEDYDTALVNLRRWIELAGDEFPEHQLAASLFLRAGETDAAQHHLTSVYKNRVRKGDEPWEAIVQILAGQPDGALAAAVFEALIEDLGYGQTLAGIKEQSRLALRFRDLELAEAITSVGIKLAGQAAEGHFWRGQMRAATRRVNDAREDYEAAVKLEPDNVEYRLALAALLQSQGESEQALAQLEALPEDSSVLFSKAAYAFEAGDEALAATYYERLGELQKNDPSSDSAYLLGQLAERLERKREALDWYSEVSQGERLTLSRMRSSVLLAELDRLAEARAMLRNLQNGNAETASNAYMLEAELVDRGGNSEEALEVYGRGLRLLPDQTQLRYARALHAEKIDRIDIAEQDLRAILDASPDDPNALNALGYTLADRTDRYDEALALISRAYEMLPEEPAIVDSMGWIHYKLGDYEKAEEFLRAALELAYDSEIAAHLGEVLWAMGRVDEALAVWDDALARDPESQVVLETKVRFVE